MQKHSKNCYNKAKYCRKYQSFDTNISECKCDNIRCDCHFFMPTDCLKQRSCKKIAIG